MALGVLAIAFAYAEARSGKRWANIPMWMGQLIIYLAPTILLCSRRRVTRAEARSVALLLPAATFGVLLCYDPSEFRFRDELQHLGTIQAILSSHHLFHANPNLPVSPDFPALEIVTSAIAFLGHASIYIAGTSVMLAAHMVTAFALYLLFFEITQSNRLAGLGVVVYALGPHYEFFDSYFIYQNIAVPFLVLTLLAIVKGMNARKISARRGWLAVGLATSIITTVSHHITSYALIGLLTCFAAVSLVTRSGRHRDLRPVILLLISVGIIGLWDFGFAKGMVGYLRPVIDAFVPTKPVASPSNLGIIGRNAKATAINTLPFPDRYGPYLSTLLFFCLVPYGNWRIFKIFKSGRASPALIAMGLSSLSFYLLLLVRLFASDGSELSGRMYTFVLIPVGLVCAIAIDGIIRALYLNRITPKLGLENLSGLSFGIASAGVLTIGGIAAGEPVFYARLPGPFVVEAGERSIDDFNVQAGLWVASHLAPYQGIASDAGTGSVIGNIGNETIVKAEILFLSPTWNANVASTAAKDGVTYIVVDQRITKQLPAAGAYFSPDFNAGDYYQPIASGDINKFNTVPGASRIYDNGNIIIYQLPPK
jgi:hypothetical protein